jgi:hypothetical protein
MRLEIPKNIPGRKSKVSESKSPGFNDDKIRGGNFIYFNRNFFKDTSSYFYFIIWHFL